VTKNLPKSAPDLESPDTALPSLFDPVPESTDSLRKKFKQKRKETQQENKSKKPVQKRAESPLLPNHRTWFKRTQTQEKVQAQPPSRRRRWFSRLGIAAGSLALLGGGAWIALEVSLPDTTHAQYTTTVPAGSMTFKSLDGGGVFYQSGPVPRNALAIQDIPKWVQEAFLATEDRRFYQHHGVDFQGIFRAVATNILSRDLSEGGSTLTQQLARLSYLNQERSVIRKLREARLAQKIEGKLTKDEILERYLNQVYLGSGAYGVGDAAWIYFSKPIAELNLTQIATLAGLPAAPSLYSPLINPEVAKKRRNEVLDRMVRSGFVKDTEASQAKQADLELKASSPPNLQDKAPYFSSYVKQQIAKVLPVDVLKAGGLTVETTMNLKWQLVANRAVEDTVYLDGYGQGFDQAALVSIDPHLGEIRSMVGGASFKDSQFNRVTQAQRQPGSTFKAFVYAAAIASGLSPYDGYQDTPFVVDGYKPKNYHGKYRGWVPIHDALTYSLNIPAVRAIIDVGFEPTLKLAHDMGIKSKLDPYYSTALGGNEVNLLELTSAYGTIADQGFRTEPHVIRRVFNRNGQVIYDTKLDRKQVLDSDSAAIMSWMLQQVVNDGTGVAARLDRPVAGKTGTSEHAQDLWFIGFIPQLVTGVWLGNDDNYKTYSSSGTAAYVWNAYMKRVAEDVSAQKFPELPPLEGRKGSIKAKPVHPADMHNISPEETGEKKEGEPPENPQ
jgi:penicillin-binding protein 1A